jgi:hypothetical protein
MHVAYETTKHTLRRLFIFFLLGGGEDYWGGGWCWSWVVRIEFFYCCVSNHVP